MEIFAGLSIVSLSGFFGVFMLKKSGLIFKSPMATASRMRDLIMAGQQRVYDIVLHYAVPFFIRVNPHSRNTSKVPNTTVSSVYEHC